MILAMAPTSRRLGLLARVLVVAIWIWIPVQVFLLLWQVPEAMRGDRQTLSWLGFYTAQIGWMIGTFGPRRWFLWIGTPLVFWGMALGGWVFSTLSPLTPHELVGVLGGVLLGPLALISFGIWLWQLRRTAAR